MFPANALTFDIDWAPDWCIAACRDICIEKNVKATFFVTHPSAVISELIDDDHFEIGIHPNFLANSSHGSEPAEIIETCLELSPDAKSMRTHALVQSTPILTMVSENYQQIDTDVSLFLPHLTNLEPVDFYFGENGRRITRLPYYWEDDVAAEWPGWDWHGGPPPSTGLRIFDFHPTYVGLNMKKLAPYLKLKQRLAGRPLFQATQEDFEDLINHGTGDRDFLKRVIDSLDPCSFKTVSDICTMFRRLPQPAFQ